MESLVSMCLGSMARESELREVTVWQMVAVSVCLCVNEWMRDDGGGDGLFVYSETSVWMTKSTI